MKPWHLPCLAADADVSDAKRRRLDVSTIPMRSSSVADNDSSSSDNDDDRSSPASSSYFVASGAEEDFSTSGIGCQQMPLRDADEGRREEPQADRPNVDVMVANHQDNDADHHRSSSLLAVAPVSSCAGSGSRTSMAGKSVSGGAEEKSCRTSTTLTTPKVGEAGNSSSRSDLELLCRLFPHVAPVTLDCVLLSCAGNVVQCIEQLLKFHHLKPSVDTPLLPVGANFAAAAAAAAAAAYAGLPHVVPTYHHHQRFVASSSFEPLAFPVPPGGGGGGLSTAGGKPPTAAGLSLMPATPFNGTDAMQQICGPGSNNAGPRGLPLGFPYPPAALLPTIAGLRYNYSAMMAAAAMAHGSSSTTGASGATIPKATLPGAAGTPLPYGLLAGSYKCTRPSNESEK